MTETSGYGVKPALCPNPDLTFTGCVVLGRRTAKYLEASVSSSVKWDNISHSLLERLCR